MHRATLPTASRAAMLLAAASLLFWACSGTAAPAATPTGTATAGARPSSPAVLTIIEPTRGAELGGASVHLVLRLDGARVVSATTTDIRPDEGHVHLYVNNALVSMNYGLEQDISVVPGTYVIEAEFVAADHAPFNPRVWSAEIFFTVR